MVAVETMGMMEISVGKFTKLIRQTIEDNEYAVANGEKPDMTPFLGIGKSGVGKTESIAGLAKELGIGYLELRLVNMTETDMVGLPYGENISKDKSNGESKSWVIDSSDTKNIRTNYASNTLLPDAGRDGERGILVFDEITSASRNVRVCSYQLMESERSLANYKLPDGWLVIALGNGPDDGGVFEGLENTTVSRCKSYRIEPELESFKRWALKNGINSSVLKFVQFQPEYLHKFNADSEYASAFPCPRTWAALSRVLNIREKRSGGKLDASDVSIYASASVGFQAASMFSAFYESDVSEVSPADVVNGTAKMITGRMTQQALYLVTAGIEYELGKRVSKSTDEHEKVSMVANTVSWILESSKILGMDMVIGAIRTLTNQDEEIERIFGTKEFDDKCPEFMKFCTVNVGIFE